MRRTTRTLSDTGPASFNDRKEKGEVTQRQNEEEEEEKEVKREVWEEVPPNGKEEKDVFAPPTPSSTYFLSSFSSKAPKTKRMVPALARYQHNPSACPPPLPFPGEKPHLAVIQPFKTTQKKYKEYTSA